MLSNEKKYEEKYKEARKALAPFDCKILYKNKKFKPNTSQIRKMQYYKELQKRIYYKHKFEIFTIIDLYLTLIAEEMIIDQYET